ncbi:MAG TPA: methyltransferase [Candidatus Nanopelagicales bacterium]|nr:methyltransferase [Candidatus Nanopelagicales bacterium]
MTSRWDGATYASVGELQRALATAEIDAVAWRGDERVLDVGCGDGAMTARIAGHVPRGEVLGVDSADAQIAYATREHAAANLRFEVQDAAEVRSPWPADVVTSFNALHWVPDLDRALARIGGAAAPGGRLVVRAVAHVQRQSLESVIYVVCTGPRWAARFSGFASPVNHRTRDDWVALVTAVGFTGVSAEVEDSTWDFGSRAGFAGWLRGNVGAWSLRLTEDEIDPFVQDVLTAYEPVGGAEGRFRFYQLRLHATRG